MRGKLLAAALLITGSALLSACGGPGGATNPTATTGNMMGGATTAAPTTSTGNQRPVVVSSKDFTEEVLLGEMYALALENAGVPVERKLNLGTTDVAQAALVKGGHAGGIDLYPEYTSTGLNNVLKLEPIYDPKQVFDVVKKGYKEQFDLVWLDAAPMNDTQAMVATKEVSEAKGIKSLQDLCDKAGDLTVAAVAEFQDRADALPLLQKTYGGCEFKEIKVFAPNLRYKALETNQADIAQAFSTDGQIAGLGLVLLEDPKNYGLPYNVAPVVRQDVLDMYPQIADALNTLSPEITNDEISTLNWEVDGKGREPQDVAKEWMQEKGLIK
ncbi:MAG TPA: glycine betaine ABC transporter substrate-binding protein [Chloroflexia bacterium]|jgi:osmoprotectant transport system substrate-binding protein